MSCWKNVGAKPFGFKLDGKRYSVEVGASVSVPDSYDYAIVFLRQHSSAPLERVTAYEAEAELIGRVAEALDVQPSEVELTPMPNDPNVAIVSVPNNGNSIPKPKKRTKKG